MKIEINESAANVLMTALVVLLLIVFMSSLKGCIKDDRDHKENMKKIELEKGK